MSFPNHAVPALAEQFETLQDQSSDEQDPREQQPWVWFRAAAPEGTSCKSVLWCQQFPAGSSGMPLLFPGNLRRQGGKLSRTPNST